MLIAKIKTPDRGEVKRFVINSAKKSFKYMNTTYHIDPNCVYISKIAAFKFKTIDYVFGNGNPVNYYSGEEHITSGKKNLDTISNLVNAWIEGKFRYFQELMIILSIAAIVVSGVACYFCYMIANSLGVI